MKLCVTIQLETLHLRGPPEVQRRHKPMSHICASASLSSLTLHFTAHTSPPPIILHCSAHERLLHLCSSKVHSSILLLYNIFLPRQPPDTPPPIISLIPHSSKHLIRVSQPPSTFSCLISAGHSILYAVLCVFSLLNLLWNFASNSSFYCILSEEITKK